MARLARVRGENVLFNAQRLLTLRVFDSEDDSKWGGDNAI